MTGLIAVLVNNNEQTVETIIGEEEKKLFLFKETQNVDNWKYVNLGNTTFPVVIDILAKQGWSARIVAKKWHKAKADDDKTWYYFKPN